MNIVQLIALGLSVGPLVLAAAIRFLLMRNTAPLGCRVAVLTALAGSIPACGAVLGLFALWSPLMPLSFDLTFRAAAPLVLGIVALPLLMIPGSRARTIGVATLSRRRMG